MAEKPEQPKPKKTRNRKSAEFKRMEETMRKLLKVPKKDAKKETCEPDPSST